MIAKTAQLHSFKAVMSLTLLLLLPGCKNADMSGQKPAQNAVAVVKVVKPQQKQISSGQSVVAPLPINFAKKKDPFRPFIAPSATISKAAPVNGRVKKGSDLPIQSYDVSQFKVSGIITGLRENRALVVDPAGKAYVLKVGTSIGLNEGRVTRITPATIEITEQFTDDSGKKRKQMVKLNLPRKQENIK